MSRRQPGLDLELRLSPPKAPRHVLIDTTGLKVFGAGERYLRKHGMGRGKRRIWKSCILVWTRQPRRSWPSTRPFATSTMARICRRCWTVFPSRLDRCPATAPTIAEGAIRPSACGAVPTIPPRRTARLSTAKDPPPFRAERDAVIQRIKDEGRYPWRTVSGATRQSLAENAVSRFKALVGVRLAAREFENQQVEALVKCRVLNRIASLGLPISERVLQG